MNEIIVLLILVLLSFLPAVGYLAWIRKTERYNTEAWGPLLRAFLFGAIISTFVSLILEEVFLLGFNEILQPDIGAIPKNPTASYIFLAVVAAPFIEEGMKALGVYNSRAKFRFLADGLVFGAAVGFGFGFVENTLYGLSALDQFGFTTAIATLLVRAVSSVLLHGSATAMSGFGIEENTLRKGRGHILAGYYLLAVLMHASFNALVSLPLILPANWTNTIGVTLLSFVTLVAAIAFAVYAFGHIRDRVTELEYTAIRRTA